MGHKGRRSGVFQINLDDLGFCFSLAMESLGSSDSSQLEKNLIAFQNSLRWVLLLGLLALHIAHI